jgi:hypothetical protein
MITYSDIKRIENMPFEDYLKIDSMSNSYLKGERYGVAQIVTETDKIKIGKFVDAILTDPGYVDMSDPLYKHAKNIAYELKNKFGAIIDKLKKQVTYTGKMSYNGYTINTKARLDFEYFDGVIDLKVTSAKNLPALIEHMGYINQVWHYVKIAGKKDGYLMIYSTATCQCKLIKLPITDHSEYWANKILKLGTNGGNEF